MLDRLRKRFESLIPSKASVAEEEAPAETEAPDPPEQEEADELGAVILARREAQKRESQLILSEKIHNRAGVLLNEVRTDLLQAIHNRLEAEVPNQSLHNLLQVTLDMGFTARLDGEIDSLTGKLFDTLREEFEEGAELDGLLPSPSGFVSELKSYRDEILRKHLLEQVEVLALPASAQALPVERGNPDALKTSVSEYWAECREALDKFFRSVEMVLFDGARDGIRVDSQLIRDRLVAAQYRNGYRRLEERFRTLYGEIAQLQMSPEPEEQKRAEMDRQIVDEIIVPLAYFIRERAEPEPREALASRGQLFREIVDKLVAVPEPFHQTAEAVKPVLRKSVEQVRPIVVEDRPYLRTEIESFNPNAIHRTTALLTVFETLVHEELDERDLVRIKQIIRLNRIQYHMFQQLEASYPGLWPRLEPLDRISDEDAAAISEIIEQTAPPAALVEDLFVKLDYLAWPDPLPMDTRRLLRLMAVIAYSTQELGLSSGLHDDEPPSAEVRSRLAKTLTERLRPGSVGTDERQTRLGAVPLPIDLNKALGTMGFHADEKDRTTPFQGKLVDAIESGGAPELADAILNLRLLQETMEAERVALGATGTDADPYFVEIWLTTKGSMVGLVLDSRAGFGSAPVEVITRDPNGGNRKETEEKLRRQLQNQAVIYQTFHKLFSKEELLGTEKRRALPAFLKKLYEPVDANRHLLLSRLRHANELIDLIDHFTKSIVEVDRDAAGDARAVLQILGGLKRKVAELVRSVENARQPNDLMRLVKEYERALKYLNMVIVHAINPWLHRQTVELSTEFEFRKEDVLDALRRHTAHRGLEWERDVESFEAHPIRGTLGCRALIQLADGSSKVVLLNYDRKRQQWLVRYLGPRVTDVVRDALHEHGRSLPSDYDEKHEQPTFSLDEQSCRFVLNKRDVARIEATLVLDSEQTDTLWKVVYLKHNDDVLTDRTA